MTPQPWCLSGSATSKLLLPRTNRATLDLVLFSWPILSGLQSALVGWFWRSSIGDGVTPDGSHSLRCLLNAGRFELDSAWRALRFARIFCSSIDSFAGPNRDWNVLHRADPVARWGVC